MKVKNWVSRIAVQNLTNQRTKNVLILGKRTCESGCLTDIWRQKPGSLETVNMGKI